VEDFFAALERMLEELGVNATAVAVEERRRPE